MGNSNPKGWQKSTQVKTDDIHRAFVVKKEKIRDWKTVRLNFFFVGYLYRLKH